jgi:carboxypeptidase D
LFADFPFVGSHNGKGPAGNNDRSPNPAQAVLPQVTEATNRVLIGNDDFDAIIIMNGTLLAIQNMTWHGHLGFQQAPSKEYVVPGQGVMGKQHFERGLLWVESYATGHLEPQQQPRATLRHLEWLLGRIDEL